ERRPATTFEYGRDAAPHWGESYRQRVGSVQTDRRVDRERAVDGLSPAQRAAMRARESLGIHSSNPGISRAYTASRTPAGPDRPALETHRGGYEARDSRYGYRSPSSSTSPERNWQPTHHPRSQTSAGREEPRYRGYTRPELSDSRYGLDGTAPRYRAN